MAKLVWDNVGERVFEAGVSRGVLYPSDVSAANGYATGVVWNGLTGVTESPSGAEANDLWADGIKYGSIRSTETYGATIEAYMYPDEFAECDGSAAVVDGVYFGQQKRKPFGFTFRSEVGNDSSSDISGDEGYKLHIIYGATASPAEKAYATINDSPDAITFSWEVASTPVTVDGYKPVSTITIDSTKVEAAKLKLIEDKLYGTSDTQATLPTPAEILAILKGTTVQG